MPRWLKGKFTPKNPEKYIGKRTPTYRSSWELDFMLKCDNDPRIHQWASEPMQIPYKNPLNGKQTMYVPDFLIVYEDMHGKKQVDLIEIKPSHEAVMSETKNNRNRLVYNKNLAKWSAAQAFCARQGITFRVITEKNMYSQKGSDRK